MADVLLLVADAVNVVTQFLNGPQWGVFLEGQQVIGQDVLSASSIVNQLLGGGTGNTIDLDFEARWNITNAPQEGGAFMSYNRVQSPYRVIMTVSAGGTASNRALLERQIEAVAGSLQLYTVLTPEGPIAGLSLIGYGYRRHAEDVGLLMVSLLFEQVRPAGDPTFSTTSVPGNSTGAAAPAFSTGTAITNPTAAAASSTTNQDFGGQSASAPTTPLQ